MQPLPSFYCDKCRTIYIIIGLTVSSDFFCLLMKSEQLRSLPFIIFLDTPSITHGTHSFPEFCQKIGGTSSIGFLLSVALSFLHLYYTTKAHFCLCANRPKKGQKVLLAQPRLPWYTENVGDKKQVFRYTENTGTQNRAPVFYFWRQVRNFTRILQNPPYELYIRAIL